jgi:hypothetical protein
VNLWSHPESPGLPQRREIFSYVIRRREKVLRFQSYFAVGFSLRCNQLLRGVRQELNIVGSSTGQRIGCFVRAPGFGKQFTEQLPAFRPIPLRS